MGRRRKYNSKGFSKEIYAGLTIGILIVIRNIPIFIQENPMVVVTGALVVGLGIIIKLYISYQSIKKEEKRQYEYLKSCRSISQLLNKFKSNPIEFENYVAKVFQFLGYKTEVTKPSNDGGKDIIMFKNEIKYVVEVKLYKETNKVGRDKIQKLHSAMIDTSAHKAIFVTTSEFTKGAIEYSKKHGIITIDGHSFINLINRAIGESEVSNINSECIPILKIENLFD